MTCFFHLCTEHFLKESLFLFKTPKYHSISIHEIDVEFHKKFNDANRFCLSCILIKLCIYKVNVDINLPWPSCVFICLSCGLRQYK